MNLHHLRSIALVLFSVLAILPTHASASAEEPQLARVFELVNAERANAGLEAVTWNSQLNVAAQSYAVVLSSDACFGHTCGPQPDMSQRIEGAGYTAWSSIGENVAAGQKSPEEVVKAWMNSPGHRANILNPRFKEMGLGMATGGRYGMYWAQEFGTQFTPTDMAFRTLAIQVEETVEDVAPEEIAVDEAPTE